MRMARIKMVERGAVYHCVSRVVGGQMLFGPAEKERLREMLWQQAEFSRLAIVTYCVMSNHVHVLLRVPGEVAVTDAELIAGAAAFYGKESPQVQTLHQAFKKRRALPQDLRAGLEERLGDVSAFMKEFKQRFSKWFNRERNRFGTLWAERFKSVLVEDQPQVVQTLAAYVDLNPVRAGLVKDPKEYRWCGYADAVAGHPGARQGLASFHSSEEWPAVAQAYREVLLVPDGTPGGSEPVALEPAAIRRKLNRQEPLSLGQVLRLRVRYFSDGVVVGSRDYVNEIFEKYRDRFGPRRKSGARRLRGLDALGDLTSMRDLQVNVLG